jgi:acetylornithine/N-succinyldiaminopimelate aminotransferase
MELKRCAGRGLMIGLEFEQPIKEIREDLLYNQKVFTGVAGQHNHPSAASALSEHG